MQLLVGRRRSQSFSSYFPPPERVCSTLLLVRNRIRFCDQEPRGLPTIRNPVHCELMTGAWFQPSSSISGSEQLRMSHRDPLGGARKRPLPEEWRDDELMTLVEAVAVFWPDGPLTVRSLRTEISRGSLTAERIAGKDLVTPTALKEMRQRCRARRTRHDSTFANEKDAIRSGSSSTQR